MSKNADFSRQLDNLSTVGIVIAVDATKSQIRLKIDENETDWIYFPALAAGAVKVWRCPTLGEQFAVVSQGGELCNAVPFTALFSDENPPPSTDPDEVLIQLPDGKFISINILTGEAFFKLKKVTFDVEQAIFTGTVHANQEISSDSDIQGKDVKAGNISLKTHVHRGVRSGNDVSGVPQ